MNRLMVPPLPAASRPSNTMTCRSPLAWLHFCSFSSSICSSRFCSSYSSRFMRSSYG